MNQNLDQLSMNMKALMNPFLTNKRIIVTTKIPSATAWSNSIPQNFVGGMTVHSEGKIFDHLLNKTYINLVFLTGQYLT